MSIKILFCKFPNKSNRYQGRMVEEKYCDYGDTFTRQEMAPRKPELDYFWMKHSFKKVDADCIDIKSVSFLMKAAKKYRSYNLI